MAFFNFFKKKKYENEENNEYDNKRNNENTEENISAEDTDDVPAEEDEKARLSTQDDEPSREEGSPSEDEQELPDYEEVSSFEDIAPSGQKKDGDKDADENSDISDDNTEEPSDIPSADGDETSEAEEPVSDENTENTENKKKEGFFSRIKSGLQKTRESIMSGIEQVLGGFSEIDDDLYDELEEALIMADIGVDTSLDIIAKTKKAVKEEKIKEVSQVRSVIIRVISDMLSENDKPLELPSPSVILVIGVNGVGKTTTIGKLTSYYRSEGRSVMLAAADTFRAAAIDQLSVWGERNNVRVIKHSENSDPAAVVFDAVAAAKNKNTDLLICDTAGRLHNKKNLMEELKKISGVITRENKDAHKEVFLVLDASTGQNALQQAKLFGEATDITGIILTKLDGTAKGGIIIAIKNELKIPIRFIGVGEGIDDLRPFDPTEFAKALFEE